MQGRYSKKPDPKTVSKEVKFDNPDFAFPDNVRKEAKKVYKASIAKGDGEVALKAAMQIAEANNLISNDSIGHVVNLYAEIAAMDQAPWRNLAYLLEAKALNRVYQGDLRNFNRRILPIEEKDTNPLLWSGEQFRKQIAELCEKSLQNYDKLAGMPINKINALLNNSDPENWSGYSVLDFITYQVLDLYSSAGITKSDGKSAIEINPVDIIERLISFDEKNLTPDQLRRGGTPALLRARLKKLELTKDIAEETINQNSEKLLSANAFSLLNEYSECTLLRAWLISELDQRGAFNLSTIGNRRQLYEMVSKMQDCLKPVLEEAKNSHSIVEGIEANTVREIINRIDRINNQLLRPQYVIQTRRQWLPTGDSIAIAAKNIKNSYLLLVPVSVSQAEGDRIYNKDLRAAGEIRELYRFKCDEKGPTESEIKLNIGALDPGYYALVISKNTSLSGIYKEEQNDRPNFVLVSELSCFTVDDDRLERDLESQRSDKWLYVVSGKDNTPISDARVEFINTYRNNGERKTLATDKEGKVSLPFDQCRAIVTYRNNRLLWNVSKGYIPYINKVKYSARVLTDLALYRPGDTIQAIVIVTRRNNEAVEIARNFKFNINLVSANYQVVDSKELATDEYGRAVADLTIPSDGLTGTFSLRVDSQKETLAWSSVEVAEYKAPTFRVIVDQPTPVEEDASSSIETSKVKVSGSVMTFSGVPVADAEVTVKLNYRPWWRWWLPITQSPAEIGASVKTDVNGRFTADIELPGNKNNYYYGVFTASAVATSLAGETQSSNTAHFSVGEGYTLSLGISDEMQITEDKVHIPVRVSDMMDHPVEKPIEYTLSKLSYSGDKVEGVVARGECKSTELDFKAKEIESGAYLLKVTLPDAAKVVVDGKEESRAESIERRIVFWRVNDSRPPMECALWVPVREYYAVPGEKEVEFTVGCGYSDGWVFMQECDGEKTVGRNWMKPSGKNTKVKVKVPEGGNSIVMHFVGCHDLKAEKYSIRIFPAEASRKTEFKIDTFRDRLTPGDKETWKFRLQSGWPRLAENGNQNALQGLGNSPVIAVLTNEALDEIVPFRWGLNLRNGIGYTTLGGIQYMGNVDLNFYGYLAKLASGKSPNFNIPRFLYLDSYVGRVYNTYYKMASPRVSRSSSSGEYGGTDNYMAVDMAMDGAPVMAEKAMAKMEAAEAEDEDLAENPVMTAGADVDNTQQEELQLRNMEMPLAFFKPLLLTDGNGDVEVEFEVPNFNTTWAFQIAGYDAEGYSAVTRLTAVASKPVMITTNMPRFLLTGDKAEISATLSNVTEDNLTLNGKIEIFDPMTGRILASKKMEFAGVAGNTSQVMTIEFSVPDDINQLAVRSIVESSKGSDGEQGILQVLPSSTPVRDATTFYLIPGQDEFIMKMPEMKNGGSVTLNYCDNPYWYVLTSLSGKLYPESESALEQAVALYSVAVSAGIIDRYPRLKEGLKIALADTSSGSSILLSPLAKNQSLKIASLNSTPWVNNSTSETMRMMGLDFLLDEKSTDKAIGTAIEGLEKTRNSNGSWSWMKGMPESEWITRQVLKVLGELRIAGYMPKDRILRNKIEEFISGGVKFTDQEVSKAFKEIVIKNKGEYSLSGELDYLYMRSNLGAPPATGLIETMEQDLFKRLPKEWKELDIEDKAIAAIMLNRKGKSELARSILESIRQFASYKDSKGMWFDKLSNSFFASSPLIVTSQCLNAYSEVEPENESVEKLSQYLVLSRQTTDWNLELGQAGVAHVVNSIVKAIREDWIPSGNADLINPDFKILLNDRELAIPSRWEQLTGNFNMDIDLKEVSGGVLKIERGSKSPAWGGIMNQYVAPIEDVKAHSVDQLKIRKALLPIDINGSGTSAGNASTKFRKGERIRVTLTVEVDRALNYLLISDQLGAWMQPADQLTEYSLQDGLWMLRETKTSNVNFYITFIPKGVYVLSYEVNADRDGEYSTGIAEAQSQYYPMITSHTGGSIVNIQ